MAVNFTETDGAAGCAAGAYCSGLTANTANSTKTCSDGGTVGSTPVSLTIDQGTSDVRALYFECTVGVGVSWDAGTWTVRLNVTTANASLELASVHICRVDSGCTNQATIGSSSALGLSLSATGVQSVNITGTAQVPAVGDVVMVVFGFNNLALMTPHAFGYTPDQNIDSPFVDAGSYIPKAIMIS